MSVKIASFKKASEIFLIYEFYNLDFLIYVHKFLTSKT